MIKHDRQPAGVLFKVAGAMHRMGIEGLPRNYELVYEAMAGTRPDLTRAFLALGENRTQQALDEIGRKYLPHHHEHEILNRSNEAMRDELGNFMRLVHRENSSLKDFGHLLSEASRNLSSKPEGRPILLDDTVRRIAEATAQKVAEGSEIAAVVAEQSSRLERVASDLDAFDKLKYVDPLTSLANRRAFNRELIRLYGEADTNGMTGIAICDIDRFEKINQRHDATIGDRFIRHVAQIIEQHLEGAALAARTGGGQFGFIFHSLDENRIVRVVEIIRSAVAATPLVNAATNVSLGRVTLSFGICMAELASTPAKIIENAADALAGAKAGGQNRTQVYAPPAVLARAGNDWSLYRA